MVVNLAVHAEKYLLQLCTSLTLFLQLQLYYLQCSNRTLILFHFLQKGRWAEFCFGRALYHWASRSCTLSLNGREQMALATTEHVCLYTDVKDTWFINSIMKVHVCLEILHMQTVEDLTLRYSVNMDCRFACFMTVGLGEGTLKAAGVFVIQLLGEGFAMPAAT